MMRLTAQENPTGQDVVAMMIRIVGDLLVDARGQVIHLGLLSPATQFSVQGSDGVAAGADVAIFEVTGPINAHFDMALTYEHLTRDGGTEQISIQPPPGVVMCVMTEEDGTECELTFNGTTGLVPRQEHNCKAWVHVGYSVTVPAGAPSGVYQNPHAINLTVEAILGGAGGVPGGGPNACLPNWW